MRVAQRRDRNHRREPAAVFAEIGQLVDILDPARRLEDQGLEARVDRSAEFEAQRLGARDHFLRIGNVGRRDLIQHLNGRIAQHAFGADVEYLDDAFRIGGDAREVGAVEDCVLQRSRFEDRLFRLFAFGPRNGAGDNPVPMPRHTPSIGHCIAPDNARSPYWTNGLVDMSRSTMSSAIELAGGFSSLAVSETTNAHGPDQPR